MSDLPFALLRPFADKISVAFFDKETPASFIECAQALEVTRFATLHQVHGNRTIVVRHALDRTEEADGMITDQPGLALIVRSADCQTFVFIEPERRIIGTLHVGWRGILAEAIPAFLREMKDHFDILPSSLYVAAGPSLCTACSTFSDPFRELPTLDRRFIQEKQVDLRGAAEEQLFTAGILPSHFERNPDCTRCRHEKYWTWRGGDREAVKTGHTNLLACALKPVIA